LELNGKHQIVFYDYDVNIFGRGLPTVKENTEVLVVASKGTV